jgi:hypothetical protein
MWRPEFLIFGEFKKMHKQVLSHVEEVLDDIRALYIKAATRVESLKVGEKVPATKLAEELAKELGKTGPTIYPILKLLLSDDYPKVKIKKGAQGGVERVAAWTAADDLDTVAPSDDDANVAGTM